MSFKQFITPHCHPGSLDTGSTPESFAKRLVELGSPYSTSTDHGTLSGAIKVYDAAKKSGLKPILGLEGYVRDDNCPILTRHGIEKDANGTTKNFLKYSHVTLHTQDQEAYQNLGRIVSRTYRNNCEKHGSESKPLFTWNDLEELGQYNITVGSGCLIGCVMRPLFKNRPDIAEEYYLKLKNCFKPGNFFVEAFPHDCSEKYENCVQIKYKDGTVDKFRNEKKLETNTGEIVAQDLIKAFPKGKHSKLLAVKNYSSWDQVDNKEIESVQKIDGFVKNDCSIYCPDGDMQKPANKFVIELAKKYGDKILISDDSHLAVAEDKIVQDIRLTNSITGSSWKFKNSYHLFSSDEAYGYFKNYLGTSERDFEEWIDNSYQWASGFDNFKLEYKPSLPASSYPEDSLKYLNQLLTKVGRMDWTDEVRKNRLRTKIDLFHTNAH